MSEASYRCRYPQAAEALHEALADDAFYATLETCASDDPAVARTAMLAYLDYSMIEAEEYGTLTMHPEQLGAAVWLKPLEPALSVSVGEQKKSFIEETMGTGALTAYSGMCANMHALTSPVVPEDAWYLSIIGIAPQAQGGGVGKQMMEEVLHHTDAAGIATYLETFTPRNIRFYERLGYACADDHLEPVSGEKYTVMLRSPD